MPSSTEGRNAQVAAAALVAGLVVTGLRAWSARRAQQVALERRDRRLERERSELFDRVVDAVDGERQELALRLHDGPQQTMTAVRLMADVARDAIRAGDRQRADEVLERLENVASDAADDLRRTTAALHPVVMAQQGLLQALASLAETLHEEYAVAASFRPPDGDWDADGERDTAVFMIAREAATNAARFGEPPVEIRLEQAADGFTMRVLDRGVQPTHDRDPGGIGVGMMRERAARIGGTLSFGTDPGAGTCTVVLRAPTRHS
jgi:signal transduction histidine kinase